VEVDNLTWKVRGPTLQASLAALEHTRGKSVFIGGLVHNSAATLPRSLALLDAIAGTFKSSVVGLYENDSTDGSAAVLAAWARRHPNAHNIHIISETLGAAPALSHGGQDKRRFAALAGYRNRYLDAYREHAPHADYLVIIDTDLFDMGMDAFLSSFTPAGLAHDWSIAGANGLFNDRRYYDRLALRTAQYPDTRKEHQSSQAGRVYEPSEPWLPVSSVFGGVAVYRGACVGACRYEADGDCEHVSFSRCVRSRPGCGKAFMNPAAVLDYALWLRKDVQFYFPSQLQALIRRHADRVREEHLRRVADGQGADGQGADGEGEGEVLLP
jgi:glycosyltransferase involved in cell wall biosynthesis